MGGLESKGDHSQWTLSNLLGREEVGHLFPEKQWRFMGDNIKHISTNVHSLQIKRTSE